MARFVHHLLALEAESCLEGIVAIVETRVNHLVFESEMPFNEPDVLTDWFVEGWPYHPFSRTSEFRLLVSEPTIPCLSIKTVETPSTC